MSETGGPFLRLAVLCEHVIEAKDGRLSIINVIEQVTQTAAGPGVPDHMPAFQVQMRAVVSLKAGKARGRFAVKLQPETPSLKRLAAVEVPVQFGGQPDAGANIILDFGLEIDEEGLYWIDALFVPAPGEPDQLISRMPLRVIYQPQKTLPQGGPQPQPPT